MTRHSVLTRVEIRKTVDTRAGRVLLALLMTISGFFLAVSTWGQETAQLSVGVITTSALTPLLVLLPIVTLMSFTSEWSTGSAMWTFLLVPDRRAVVMAKLSASAVTSAVVVLTSMLLSLLVATVVSVVTSRPLTFGDYWGSDTGVNQALVPLASGLLFAAALGLLIRSSTTAVSTYFVFTIFVQGLIGSLLGSVSPYLSLDAVNIAVADWTLGDGGLLAVATAALLWLVIPAAIGVRRYSQSDVD